MVSLPQSFKLQEDKKKGGKGSKASKKGAPATPTSPVAPAPPTGLGSGTRQEYEAWFRQADKNNDGILTTKELKGMFKSRGYKTSSKEFKRQFSSLDRDSDKKISLEEYLIGMGQIPEFEHKQADIQQVFERADKNGDGHLDMDEMMDALREMKTGLTNKQMFDIIHRADTDNSGQIDYNEFVILYLREQGVFSPSD